MKVSWFDQQMRRSHCFWRTLMLDIVEIVFRIRILLTLLWHSVLLPSGLALFIVCFLIWILTMEIRIQMFPLVYKQVGRELAPKLAIIFRHMVKGIVFRLVGD